MNRGCSPPFHTPQRSSAASLPYRLLIVPASAMPIRPTPRKDQVRCQAYVAYEKGDGESNTRRPEPSPARSAPYQNERRPESGQPIQAAR
jgi:hypothetical protein